MNGMRQFDRVHPTARVAGVALILAALATIGRACPFCTVESQTLSEELNSVDAAVLVKLVEEAKPIDQSGAMGDATFEIVDVLRGKDRLGATKQIDVTYFGPPDREQMFLITGIGSEPIGWTTPLPLSPVAVEYVRKLGEIAPSGTDRLAFFQDYLEHSDPLLAQDAYDEFARAPYDELHDLADRMDKQKLLAWIGDPQTSPSGRRLYLTMLSTCGTQEDLPLLEAMILSNYAAKKPLIESLVTCGLGMGGPVGLVMWPELVQLDERQQKLGLDALVACYLTLRGPDGLELIERRFLRDPKVEYTYIYSTIMALRFHGETTDVLPRERLLESMRLLLDNRDFADQVIPDLARWEDWSVLDRLTEMFKNSEGSTYVRQPIVTYLIVAGEQEGDVGERAKVALAELETLDPEAVEQARNLSAFGFLARARGTATGAGATRPTAEGALSAIAESTGGSGEGDDEGGIPDPADFQDDDSTAEPQRPIKAISTAAAVPLNKDDESDALSPDGSTPTAGEEGPAIDGTLDFGAEPIQDGEFPEAQPPSELDDAGVPRSFAPPNRWWSVGVPLAASVVLMGLYWLILRSGAV
jgi:hypothetical protein